MFPLDGALNESAGGTLRRRQPRCRSRPQHRERVGHAKDDAENVEWARTTWRDMRQFSTGGTYINFLNEEEGDERTRAAYRTNYARLVQVKAKWDPANVFRTNKNIGSPT